MKKLLVIYQKMIVGGSTTSLLSFLEKIDKTEWEVDLILSRSTGEMLDSLPEGVRLLPAAIPPSSKAKKILLSLFHKEFYRRLLYRLFVTKKRYTLTQLNAYNAVHYARRLTEVYDTAIGYLEFFPNAYLLSDCVKAKRKIAWIHTDYEAAGLDARVDAPYFRKADKIVLVSPSCRESFARALPHLSDKTAVVENMLSRSLLERSAAAYTPDNIGEGIRLLTVCRLDVHTKGLDRLAEIAARLKKDGYRFTWTVVGDGEMEAFTRLITEHGVADVVNAVGGTPNPYPYFRAHDCFVLPSRYEGKPMVIPEAQRLSLPCIVSAYASAAEQITNGVDGIIAENSTDALYCAIKSVIENSALLPSFQKALHTKTFDCSETLEKIRNEILR